MEKQIDNDIDISKNKFEYKLIGPYINTDKYSYIEISITFNNIIVSGLFYIPELKINSNINQLNFNSYDDSDDIQDINLNMYYDNGSRYYYNFIIKNGFIELTTSIAQWKVPIIPEFHEGLIKLYNNIQIIIDKKN
jgi:hypothetical protein